MYHQASCTTDYRECRVPDHTCRNQYHLLNGDTIEYSNSDRDWLIYYTCLGLS